MKKLIRFALMIIIPLGVIISSYAIYDYLNSFTEYRPRIAVSGAVSPRLLQHQEVETTEPQYARILVIDLNGDGIKIRGLYDSHSSSPWQKSAYFDFNNDGFAEEVGVTGKDDAILVYKMSRDVQVKGGEVLGNYFTQNRLGENAGALDILQEFNQGTKQIKAGTPTYNNLRLWTNGRSGYWTTDNNLKRLSEHNIATINLDAQALREVDAYGNIHGKYADVIFNNGQKSIIQEIWLRINPTLSSHKPLRTEDEIKKFPNIQGFGQVISLWQAMHDDQTDTLKKLVANYLNEPSCFKRKAQILDIIYSWTSVQNINPLSRISEDGVNYIGDARKLEVLEKFMGQKFHAKHARANEPYTPHEFSAPKMLKAFNDLEKYVEIKFISSAMKEYIDSIKLQWNKDTLKWEIEIKEDFFKKIETYYQQVGEVKTKLMLDDLYSVFDYNQNTSLFGQQIMDNIIEKIRKSGDISAHINLKNFGTMITKGTSEKDNLIGTDGNDIVIGYDSDDVLSGGLGDDLYSYSLHDGYDVISDIGGDDAIAFSGNIAFADITYGIDKLDLLISIKADNRQGIRIKNFALDNAYKVERLQFSDGGSLNLEAVYNELLAQNPSLKTKMIFYRIFKKFSN